LPLARPCCLLSRLCTPCLPHNSLGTWRFLFLFRQGGTHPSDETFSPSPHRATPLALCRTRRNTKKPRIVHGLSTWKKGPLASSYNNSYCKRGRTDCIHTPPVAWRQGVVAPTSEWSLEGDLRGTSLCMCRLYRGGRKGHHSREAPL
jgi:hypothetical protein